MTISATTTGLPQSSCWWEWPRRARAQGVETVTNVPFAFTAGDTNLPRDEYRISPMPGHNGVFMVRGLRHGVVLMSRTDRSNDREPAPSLTFHRYGDRVLPQGSAARGWKDLAPLAVACGEEGGRIRRSPGRTEINGGGRLEFAEVNGRRRAPGSSSNTRQKGLL